MTIYAARCISCCFLTILKNELLCWFIKMPCVLYCSRLERPYKTVVLNGPTKRDTWDWDPLKGGVSFKLVLQYQLLFFFSALLYDQRSVSEDFVHLSHFTKASIPTEFPLCYCLPDFHQHSPSLVFVSPAPLWNPYNSVHSASSDITLGFLPSHPLISW